MNRYEMEKRVTPLQGIIITDEHRRIEHQEVMSELRNHAEMIASLKRGSHLTPKELQEAAKKKRRLREADERTQSLVGRLVQTRPGPNGTEADTVVIQVKESVYIKESEGIFQEWLEGPVAVLQESGRYRADPVAFGIKRLKRTAVKLLPAASAGTESDLDEQEPSLSAQRRQAQERVASHEGERARVLPGAVERGSKWDSWVLAQLPVGLIKKFHPATTTAKGRKPSAAYYSVDFRLRGRELSGGNALVDEDETQLVTIKINPEGLRILPESDATRVSVVTEHAKGRPHLLLQRPWPGQKVRCVRRVKDVAIYRYRSFDAKISDKVTEKECAYFHDAKKGDCVRVYLEDKDEQGGDAPKLAVFSRDPDEFYFEGVLPENHALRNDKEQLAGVTEATKVLLSSAPAAATTTSVPFELDRLHLAALKSKLLPQDISLETGWGRLAVKVLGQPQGQKRGGAKLLLELPFCHLERYILEVPASSCRRLEGEASPNADSVRRLFEPERFIVGTNLVMRLKFPKCPPVDGVSCRVISYDDTTKSKPTWTLAVPGVREEFRLTLPVSASSFDNGADEGPVFALPLDEPLPPNSAEVLGALTRHILETKGKLVHKENKLVLRIPEGAKKTKEPEKWLRVLQAEHALLATDIGAKDKVCRLIFEYPDGKRYKKEAPRSWLGKFLFLDDAPALNKPPRPQEGQVVNILGGDFKGRNGRVESEAQDVNGSFLVQVHTGRPSEMWSCLLSSCGSWLRTTRGLEPLFCKARC